MHVSTLSLVLPAWASGYVNADRTKRLNLAEISYQSHSTFTDPRKIRDCVTCAGHNFSTRNRILYGQGLNVVLVLRPPKWFETLPVTRAHEMQVAILNYHARYAIWDFQSVKWLGTRWKIRVWFPTGSSDFSFLPQSMSAKYGGLESFHVETTSLSFTCNNALSSCLGYTTYRDVQGQNMRAAIYTGCNWKKEQLVQGTCWKPLLQIEIGVDIAVGAVRMQGALTSETGLLLSVIIYVLYGFGEHVKYVVTLTSKTRKRTHTRARARAPTHAQPADHMFKVL
jgi:hypothetical protein